MSDRTSVTYIDVILPLALPQLYTYAVPFDWIDFLQIGQRVLVQFGKNKFYAAIVDSIHHHKPTVEAKLMESILDEAPIVSPIQLTFWKWMANYYLCTVGEVMLAALPAGLRLSSETKIMLNDQYEGDFESLNSEEFIIVQALKAQVDIDLKQVQDILQKKNVHPYLKNLLALGIAITSEELKNRFTPKTELFVKLHAHYESEIEQEKLFEIVQKAPKQMELLLSFTHLSKINKFVRKKDLLEKAKVDSSVLKRLVEKNIFQEFKVVVSRLGNINAPELAPPPLSALQEKALAEIKQQLQIHSTVLLHGVTGSGKTQVYLELMKEEVAKGNQVLYLLPEIALTAQIIDRLKYFFGNKIGVYHSKFNENERVEIWNKVLQKEYTVIVSARSGLFLPFQNLGLVILDEEHDASLKQIDPNPRYHARDSSIVLAKLFSAKVILGTATPSLESFYNAERGKFGLVNMSERFGNLPLPEIWIENISSLKSKENTISFSDNLIAGIRKALLENEQVILFLNRRGFSKYQICKTCAHVYTCKNCDVSLTYHKFQNRLICHYCGYAEKLETACKACGVIDLAMQGEGTEKIEEEINLLFPDAKVGRLDLDSTRSKHGHAEMLAKFENREIDILVGTQMVTKGLDFDHVSLVGVISADPMLFFPNFRSFERAFAILTQVSGRAGRKKKMGQVIIQTAKPNHPIIQLAKTHNYAGLYQAEIKHRQQFNYPPFSRMVQLQFRAKNQLEVDKAALYFVQHFKKLMIAQILGPTIPFVSKVNNVYLRDVLIKTNQHTKGLVELKLAILTGVNELKGIKDFKAVTVRIDVDPQ